MLRALVEWKGYLEVVVLRVAGRAMRGEEALRVRCALAKQRRRDRATDRSSISDDVHEEGTVQVTTVRHCFRGQGERPDLADRSARAA